MFSESRREEVARVSTPFGGVIFVAVLHRGNFYLVAPIKNGGVR